MAAIVSEQINQTVSATALMSNSTNESACDRRSKAIPYLIGTCPAQRACWRWARQRSTRSQLVHWQLGALSDAIEIVTIHSAKGLE